MSRKPGSLDGSPSSERQAAGRLLRERAEAIASEQGIESKERLDDLSVEKMGKILHELYVHQIELDMQNEELQRMQVELDAARARYFDLYELAPSGYCSLDENGVITEANLTLANQLGVPRKTLIDQPIFGLVFRDDLDLFRLLMERLLKTGEVQSRELRLAKADGTPLRVHLVASLGYAVGDGRSEIRCMTTEVPDRPEPQAPAA